MGGRISSIFSSRPVVALTVFLMVGIIFGARLPVKWWMGGILSTSLLSILIFKIYYRQNKGALHLLLLLFFGLGVALSAWRENPHIPDNHIFHYADKGKLILGGKVVKPPIHYNDHTVIIAKIDRILMKHHTYMPVT